MWSVPAGEQMPDRCVQRECRVSIARADRCPEYLMTLLCREQILDRKRREYRDMVPNYYDIQAAERSAEDDTALRQVRSYVICLSPIKIANTGSRRLFSTSCVLDPNCQQDLAMGSNWNLTHVLPQGPACMTILCTALGAGALCVSA